MILFVIQATDPVTAEADLLRALRAAQPGDRVRLPGDRAHPTSALLPPAVLTHALDVLQAEGTGDKSHFLPPEILSDMLVSMLWGEPRR